MDLYNSITNKNDNKFKKNHENHIKNSLNIYDKLDYEIKFKIKYKEK
jgi:hypothetical protein